MSDHVIVWEFNRDHVTGEAVCNAGDDALCRNMPNCDCEIWLDISHDEQGWFHTAEGNPPQLHRHDTPGDCNICEWLNASDIEECAEGRPTFDIARTPIEPVWTGDFYEWKPL